MNTYQDLVKQGDNEKARIEFIKKTINDHRQSRDYRIAVDASLYYDGENPTINRYEKVIYDLQGKAHKDMYTANHKIASSFFGFATDQLVSYLLGNGVALKTDILGESFDRDIIKLATEAVICGQSFGFWNKDHIEVFTLREFAPLLNEETGALSAGVRFWQLDKDKPLRATLYELDGYTEYIMRKGEDMIILHPKRDYKLNVQFTVADGEQIVNGENYDSFPIVPLKYNDNCKSGILGKRNTIDALDLACSNMVNNVDEGNLIYWVLTNCGGMDDLDDIKFIERLKTVKVAHADGDAGAAAEAKTIEAPFEGTNTTIDMLIKKLYTDFQCFNSAAVSAGNQTATAIRASYTPLDLKADKFETQISAFISSVLELSNVEDEPTYTRNRITNVQEEVQSILLAAPYLDDEYITQKILSIFGDADRYEEIEKRKTAEETNRVVGIGAVNA